MITETKAFRLHTVIFDMDGVIIDSEPFWRQAMMEIFAKVGLQLSDEMCASTAGLRIDEVVDHWHKISPWKHKAKKEIVEEIIEAVRLKISNEGKALPGLFETIALLKKNNIRIALASSSAKRLIVAVLNRLGLGEDFEVMLSGEEVESGKPHPVIFLEAAKRMGVLPQDCCVIEDSLNGIIAAKAARMYCIAIPEAHNYGVDKFIIADKILLSLEDFKIEYLK